MSGSSVPEAARAAKAESDARLDRWFGAYCEAKALGGSGRAGLYRLMALADAEVAAAVAEERATTGRAGAPYDEIHAERLRAHAKHAETSMESQPVHDPEGTRRDILVEEIGEVSREFNEARHDHRPVDLAHLRVELIQVAAMASAWVAAIDGNSLAALASPGEES